MNETEALDRHWAQLLQCDVSLLHLPKMHLIEGHQLETPMYMGYVMKFLAVMPLHTPGTVTVMSTRNVIDDIGNWPTISDTEELEQRLLASAQSTGLEDSYVFDILVAAPDQLNLVPHPDVEQDDEAFDWDGNPLAKHTDGAKFVTRDENGITAWAGEKCITPHARDLQVAVREDARRHGLAMQVTSRSYADICERGYTPFYAHLRGNSASASLAAKLGFRPYASAVLAEEVID